MTGVEGSWVIELDGLVVIGVFGVVIVVCVGVLVGVNGVVKFGGLGDFVVTEDIIVDCGIDVVIDMSNGSLKILKWEQLRVIV
jgi:hypothetical protein